MNLVFCSEIHPAQDSTAKMFMLCINTASGIEMTKDSKDDYLSTVKLFCSP